MGVVISPTETTMQTDPNTLNAVIDHLAAKLAVPASQLYAVLTKQVYVDVVQNALWVVLMGAAAYLTLRLRTVAAKAAEEHRGDSDLFWVGYGLLCIAVGVGVVVALNALVTLVGELLNPQYYALHILLDALK